jgi:hypothetical protein
LEGKKVSFQLPPLEIIFPFFTHQNPALYFDFQRGNISARRERA